MSTRLTPHDRPGAFQAVTPMAAVLPASNTSRHRGRVRPKLVSRASRPDLVYLHPAAAIGCSWGGVRTTVPGVLVEDDDGLPEPVTRRAPNP